MNFIKFRYRTASLGPLFEKKKIQYVRAFMLLTETLQDVRRTSLSRPNRLALHQLTISKYMEQPFF